MAAQGSGPGVKVAQRPALSSQIAKGLSQPSLSTSQTSCSNKSVKSALSQSPRDESQPGPEVGWASPQDSQSRLSSQPGSSKSREGAPKTKKVVPSFVSVATLTLVAVRQKKAAQAKVQRRPNYLAMIHNMLEFYTGPTSSNRQGPSPGPLSLEMPDSKGHT